MVLVPDLASWVEIFAQLLRPTRKSWRDRPYDSCQRARIWLHSEELQTFLSIFWVEERWKPLLWVQPQVLQVAYTKQCRAWASPASIWATWPFQVQCKPSNRGQSGTECHGLANCSFLTPALSCWNLVKSKVAYSQTSLRGQESWALVWTCECWTLHLWPVDSWFWCDQRLRQMPWTHQYRLDCSCQRPFLWKLRPPHHLWPAYGPRRQRDSSDLPWRWNGFCLGYHQHSL